MRRIDRAMYAFFLLALLGDVARVRVPVDAGGGLTVNAASQYRVEALGAAGARLGPGVRRSGGVFRPAGFRPIEKIKSYSLSLIRWAWSLSASAHAADVSGPAVLASEAYALSFGLAAFFAFSLLFGSSPAVFEHVGSPAP